MWCSKCVFQVFFTDETGTKSIKAIKVAFVKDQAFFLMKQPECDVANKALGFPRVTNFKKIMAAYVFFFCVWANVKKASASRSLFHR